jgi:hypothetical protein
MKENACLLPVQLSDSPTSSDIHQESPIAKQKIDREQGQRKNRKNL